MKQTEYLTKIKSMTKQALQKELATLRADLQAHHISFGTSQSKKSHLFYEIKSKIARVMMVLNSK